LLRQFLPAYLQKYPQTPAGVLRVFNRLASCRTPALGGHVLACTHCGEITYHYHSCGDRHCPSCGGSKRASWLARQQRDLLPVPYFHLVFTLPHELSALVLGNRKILYKLLFAAAQDTLLTIGADPKHVGARLGAIMVLHTWGQQLEHHPHIHALVPGGGLSQDGTAWVATRPNFLVSVKVLSRLFRRKYVEGLHALYAAGQLRFGGSTESLRDQVGFQAWLRMLRRKGWIVYAKKPFAGPEVLLKYLTRYTHRVALSNRRLLRISGDDVTLTWKDYRDAGRGKEMTLSAIELLRRFALHVMVKNFVRVRQCGLLAHRGRKERLALCRRLFMQSAVPPSGDGASVQLPVNSPQLSPANDPRDSATGTQGPSAACPSPPPTSSDGVMALALLALTVSLCCRPLAWLFASMPALPPPQRCSSCGRGELLTIWEKPRPRARTRSGKKGCDTS
jgi:Putative transposase/Transposase zinc-binding domain